MKSIKTVGDLVEVLSIYDKDLPLEIEESAPHGKRYDIGTDHCIVHMVNKYMGCPDTLRIHLLTERAK
jgi:hypothetical protein